MPADRRTQSLLYWCLAVKEGTKVIYKPLRAVGVYPFMTLKAERDEVVRIIGAAHSTRDNMMTNYSRLTPASLTHAKWVVGRVRYHQIEL